MDAPKSAATRASRSRRWILITFATAGTVGGVTALFSALGLKPTAWLASGIAATVFALTFWFAWKWWQAIDEAAREAHKTGWYWGGTAGLLISLVLFTGLHFADPAVSLARYAMIEGDAGLILTGIAVTITAQLIGYGLVWSGWWFLRGR
ncbi:MAG: hypothetical protein JWR84_2304 [Caulobacter sp.]|nr:hypothetical protein [Caulobacter sp.]